MQILAEGTAVAIFRFLEESQVEPVLCELLPYIEKDEARHVGLGVLHLPQLLSTLTPRQCRKLGSKVHTIGDLFAATQLRYAKHYRALGLEPRELIRRADKVLHELAQKLGTIPGTDEPYFRTANPAESDYEDRLDFVVTRPGRRRTLSSRIVQAAIDVGARLLPV
jgi:hypothetical protein